MGESTVLVTGGAGYIGSHVTRQLVERGERVVVLDNLSTGFREAVEGAELVVGDTGDAALVNDLMARHAVDTLMHFAAHTVVPESVADPLKYYRNNTNSSRILVEACVANGVRRVVFSSTAAVYGEAGDGTVAEDSPLHPINPYGRSKLATEWVLEDLATAGALEHVTLRYFNVAGCAPDGRIGQSTPNATLLIKVAAEAAAGIRAGMHVFGTDYPTPDGTCIRDFIHVEDLAHAHVLALDHLRDAGASLTLNCGYGHGYSVLEVLRMVEQVAGAPLKINFADRRPGDPVQLVANAARIRETLGWTPRHDDLEVIVRTAIDWERNRRY
ncbi:UDP-glucose 4-epimerase GalE [Aquisalimonas asiatica]|uniref:UDP-glucose 4-epimerase n=1 Tax=Aquisalimonas asiatica TaxID=406100 RepID=A0A1H8U5M5_9GAMM|nr:UDP-glucose 4-epimerase GalE [Aquisalimonas asiatica]SEO98471.1 UDP-glucose 4-epimerase [Aquisalimonas asiatica]